MGRPEATVAEAADSNSVKAGADTAQNSAPAAADTASPKPEHEKMAEKDSNAKPSKIRDEDNEPYVFSPEKLKTDNPTPYSIRINIKELNGDTVSACSPDEKNVENDKTVVSEDDNEALKVFEQSEQTRHDVSSTVAEICEAEKCAEQNAEQDVNETHVFEQQVEAESNTMESKLLKDKKIIIIGGATGQGAAAAREAAKLGASVVVISRRSPQESFAAGVIRDCKACGTGVYKFIQADASKEEQIFPAVKEAAEFMGGITGLLCCAHSASIAPSDDISLEEFQADIENNLYATVLPCQAAFPYLKESKGSILTNIANSCSSFPIWLGAYTAAKMAVVGWSRTIAREWAPFGIRVNILECVTTTEATTGHPVCDNPEYLPRNAKLLNMLLMDNPDGNPFDYVMAPQVSAYYTCFLLSDLAPWTTNQIIKIDGGCSASAI